MAKNGRLGRPFRALMYDWDGTAVVDRPADASHVAALIDELLRREVWNVIVTGTNFGHIDRQLCQLLPTQDRGHLLVCTNRGSEVFGFAEDGARLERWVRVASPREDAALTATAEAVRDEIKQRTGLEIGIVYDRLNRRKIDLIPLPEWVDPPKDRIGDLLLAVEARLRAGGLAGGIGDVVELTQRLAVANALSDPRITSDVKHVEVGLTDKGDAVKWVRRELIEREGITGPDLLVIGDEFGPVAGFAGSDDRLRQVADNATVVSVGAEPNGVPAGVIHLDGGPATFAALLAEQIALHARGGRREADQPTPTPALAVAA
jgi:hypothetical protein